MLAIFAQNATLRASGDSGTRPRDRWLHYTTQELHCEGQLGRSSLGSLDQAADHMKHGINWAIRGKFELYSGQQGVPVRSD